MPKAKRDTALYRRGVFWLDWDRKRDGTLRSPNLAIFWYDSRRGGNRSTSARTADISSGKAALDALFLKKTGGCAVCPTCHRPLDHTGALALADAIVNYQVLHADNLDSAGAVHARLAHVLDYLEESDQGRVTCAEVDERWIAGFRKWAATRPIVSTKGRVVRDRSLSTIENSVIQLASAISFAKLVPNFRPQQVKELNRTPHHRSDVAELAAMFRYCVAPQGDWSAKERARRIRERSALHRFLIVSVGTLARPDAAYDVSTDPKRSQWVSNARILNLCQRGRRQTKKYRATVKVAWQVALHLDAAPKGFFVGRTSIRSAWDAMVEELDLPREGEAGQKLIRRSMAHLLRSRGVPVEQVEVMLGHRKIDATSELYAPFDPAYMSEAVAEVEKIIGEIEALTPGAFALPGAKVVTIGRKA